MSFNSGLASFAARLRRRIIACTDLPQRRRLQPWHSDTPQDLGLPERTFGSLPPAAGGDSRAPVVGVACGQADIPVFDQLALELFALQFERNAPYRRLCEARGARPDTVADWTEIPSAPTSAFKEFDLSCLPAGERTTVFHSSGTTGAGAEPALPQFRVAGVVYDILVALVLRALPIAAGQLPIGHPYPAARRGAAIFAGTHVRHDSMRGGAG